MKTAIATKSPEEVIDVLKWNGYSIEAAERATKLTVTNDDEERSAIDTTKQIKMFAKEAEDARKEKKAPFAEMAKRIDGAFKPILDGLASAEETIKRKILAYQMEKEKVRQAEEKKRREEYEAKLAKAKEEEEAFGAPVTAVAAPLPLLEQSGPTRASYASASQKSIWRFEIEDVSKIPLELMMPNETLIGQRVRAGIRSIPGIRIYEEKSIAIR